VPLNVSPSFPIALANPACVGCCLTICLAINKVLTSIQRLPKTNCSFAFAYENYVGSYNCGNYSVLSDIWYRNVSLCSTFSDTCSHYINNYLIATSTIDSDLTIIEIEISDNLTAPTDVTTYYDNFFIATSTSALSDFESYAPDLIDSPLENLNYNSSAPSSAAIVSLITPYNGYSISLGTRSTTSVRFAFDYYADYFTSSAYIELINTGSGLTYYPYIQSTSAGYCTYNKTFDLPAGSYIWRPILAKPVNNTLVYYNFDDTYYSSFYRLGTTTTWYGSYTQTASSTFWSVSTSTTVGTSTYSDIFMFPSFGEAVCGVNMSCAIPLCIKYPNICERFPFSFAADFYSVFNAWSEILNSSTVVPIITYDLDIGVATYTVTMLDLSDQDSLAVRLADRVRYWSSLALWCVFSFWSFAFIGRILS